METAIHKCIDKHDKQPEDSQYGPAIKTCLVYTGDTGQWWAGNDEYSTEVFYCPWCGVELSTIKKKGK